MVRAFKFEERSQFLVGADDETLSIVAMCVCNPDRSPVGIHCGRTAPTPTGFADIVSDDFPILHSLGAQLLFLVVPDSDADSI